MLGKMKSFVSNHKYAVVGTGTSLVTVASAVPAFASETGTATLTGTLSIFTEVLNWFLESGATMLTWMLDKPIILLSLSIFFIGSVIGVLSRIYNAF